MADSESYQAIVEKIIRDGRHGAYVVTTCELLDAAVVTFSLSRNVWQEENEPEPGM